MITAKEARQRIVIINHDLQNNLDYINNLIERACAEGKSYAIYYLKSYQEINSKLTEFGYKVELLGPSGNGYYEFRVSW